MSPLFVTAEGRACYAPADRISELHDFAQCLEHFIYNAPSGMTIREFIRLRALMERLSAYADLLSTDDVDQLLADAVAAAGEYVGYVKTTDGQ